VSESKRDRLREQLLAQAATRTAEVTIGGESYRVREVEAETFSAYAMLLATGGQDGKNAKQRREQAFQLILSECVIDDEGEPLLTPEEAGKVAGVARLAFPLVNKILDLSGFSAKAKKAD
jgi:hypothetical protein